MTGTCAASAACPVCATPDQHDDFCPVCRWRLHDGLVLGGLTAEDLEIAERGLRAAEHAWDLRAAGLSHRSQEGGRRVAAVTRGGPPGRDVEKPPGTGPAGHRSPPGLRALLGGLLDNLLDDRHGGCFKELSFVEFTADGLHMIKVTVGEAGIPLLNDAGSMTWRSLVPAFDPDEDVCRFQLAGGIGTLPPVDHREFDRAVLRWLTARLPAVPDPPVVLLLPPPGWVLLERAAAAVREACPPKAELPLDGGELADGVTAGRTTTDAVRRLVRTLPLVVDHTLLLARADRDTGIVRHHSHVLFPEGTRLVPGRTATAEVTVYGGIGRAALYLPVLAGVPAADGTGAPTVSVHQTECAALEPVRLSFVLRGPGEVDLVAPSARTPVRRVDPAAVEVPGLNSDVPRRVVRPPRLELFFTVELSGADPGETEERLTFVREVSARLAQRDHVGTAVRVGAVGHYDHRDYESPSARPGTLMQAPVLARPPAGLPAALAGWAHARRRQDMVSSVEDALREVPLPASGDPDDGGVRRVVLIVARRPPAAPPGEHGIVPACPRTDWRTALARLRSHGVRVMTRVDPEAGPSTPDTSGRAARRYADEAFGALGADGAFRPGIDSAADVAERLLPPWGWEGPDCRLAFATPLV